MKEELMEEGIGEMGRKSQEKVKVQLFFYLLERGQPLSLLARVPQSAFSGISGSPTRASNAAEQAGRVACILVPVHVLLSASHCPLEMEVYV